MTADTTERSIDIPRGSMVHAVGAPLLRALRRDPEDTVFFRELLTGMPFEYHLATIRAELNMPGFKDIELAEVALGALDELMTERYAVAGIPRPATA